jgi:putative FmdB family regulatory protein
VPIYAFICEGCGPFDVMRPIVQASEAAACPTCGGETRRVFSPPGLALVARPMRRVRELEEKSAHEPDVATEKRGRPLPHRHAPTPPWVLEH